MKAVSRHYRTILLAALVTGCTSPDPPEAALRAWLGEAEAAAEARDRDALMDLVSERYLDAEGNDREALGQKLRLFLLRHRRIEIVSRIEELTITGGSAARVVVSAVMGTSGDGVLDLDADARRFELELELEGDDWRLIGARWNGS